MHKRCHNCGIPRKITFRCNTCGELHCLGCFNFVKGLCCICSGKEWQKEYEGKLEAPIEKELLP